MGRSAGPGWGWAMYEHGKMSAKEAALWAGRQAEVKKVKYVITIALCQDMRPKGATQSWRMACKLQAMSMRRS